ncbi:acyl-CoA dehydrogenase family protein [Nocardia wallacei]|uniref:acyl-CoA dehydrogenase family protein n=1 Tax=Nocardia wallacei TaxID=480035 RepID=UPI002456BD24|nr:acyl-CoA dehydrogenase family protein [Nocardia wallacei]
MTGEFDDLHDDLRTAARALLAATDHETPVDWSRITRAGWLGLEASGEMDGAGATFAELAVLLEEIGRAAAYTAYPSVAVLGIAAFTLVEPNPLRDSLFRDTVSGKVLPIVVMPGEWEDSPENPRFRLSGDPAAIHLDGSADFVPDAPAADRLLIPARTPDGEILIVAVDPATPGVTVTNQPLLDATRIIGHVAAQHVPIRPDSLWRLPGGGTAALRHLHDRAAVATACDSLGLIEAMLAATVEYARAREQFGRAIGSFQAVQHACADMLVQARVARQLVTAAVRAHGTPTAATTAAMAKSYATTAAVQVVGKAMQLHGGIGYTWESGIHAYLKRATLNRSLYGTPATHRRTLAHNYS